MGVGRGWQDWVDPKPSVHSSASNVRGVEILPRTSETLVELVQEVTV